MIFCLALIQWFWYHHKKVRLFSNGLYSRVRHPQFLGIIVMSLGLTIKGSISVGHSSTVTLLVPHLPDAHVGLSEFVGLWFLEVLGYLVFAMYEERYLSKKFSNYNEYKQKVALLLPIKNPKRIPEGIFTVLLVIGICVILFLLPYDFIRVNSYRYIPAFQFP